MIDYWMDKGNGINIHNEINTCNKKVGTGNHCVKWNKQATENERLSVLIDMKSKSFDFIKPENIMVVTRCMGE